MAGQPSDDYVRRYVARHENRMTQVLTVVGDVLYVGGPVVWLFTRRPRLVLAGLAAGAAVTAAAHLFKPGTLLDELRATFGHPLWAARAELTGLRTRAHDSGDPCGVDHPSTLRW